MKIDDNLIKMLSEKHNIISASSYTVSRNKRTIMDAGEKRFSIIGLFLTPMIKNRNTFFEINSIYTMSVILKSKELIFSWSREGILEIDIG